MMKDVFLVLAIGLGSVMAADAVCTEVPVNNMQMVQAQNMPKEFIVDIEVVKKEEPLVQNMRLYYGMDMIRLDILDRQVASSMYFYFKYNEVLKFDFSPKYGRGHCTVVPDLGNSVDNFLFGGVDPSAKSPSIPAPLAALHFMGLSGIKNDKIQENYQGKAHKRSKEANKYTSCQRWKSAQNDITLNVTHYFALESIAFPYIDHKTSTLLSMELTGTGKVAGVPNVKIDHMYNFYNLRGFEESDTSFETPEGIVCKGRKVQKTFPTLPPYIKFSGEVVDKLHNKFFNKEELYDSLRKYAIIKVVKKLGSDKDLNKKTYMFDFPMNKVLIIDDVETSCQISDLSTFSGGNNFLDLFTMKRGKAVMSDPSQFFLASNTKDFTYLGQKRIRGMNTDVWVAPTNIANYTNAVVQFHFAPKVSSWNDKNKAYVDHQWPVSVRTKVWLKNTDIVGITENTFDVDYNAVGPNYIDVTPCYKYQYHMQVVVKATRAQIVNSYQNAFIYEAMQRIAQAGTLSPTEITQMKLFYDSENMFVEFIVGGEGQDKIKKAVSDIKKAFTNGQLVLTARHGISPKWNVNLPFVEVNSVDVYAANNAAKNVKKAKSTSDSGYSAGAMGGLGFAMIIIGLTGGAGVGFAHGKYFG